MQILCSLTCGNYFPKLLYSLHFQIFLSKTLRSSLNMGKYYSSSSCHWQHRKIKHTLLIWTQVHSCYHTARVSPTVTDESNSPNCIWALKCLKQQAPPALSGQLQTSSWNYEPNETKHPNIWEWDVKTLGKIMSNM